MSRSLVTVTEMYRIDTEKEVEAFIQELKSESAFQVQKYSSQKRQKKAKGEVVDEWIRFSVTKQFDEESVE